MGLIVFIAFISALYFLIGFGFMRLEVKAGIQNADVISILLWPIGLLYYAFNR